MRGVFLVLPDISFENEDLKKNNEKGCLYQIQTFLAKRTHSETELYNKLLKKGFSKEEIKKNIEFAKTKKWLEDPNDISDRVINKWNDKNKSHKWIENYLNEKGLPGYERDSSLEVKKASRLLAKKFGSVGETNYNKASQYIASRGFLLDDFEEAVENLKEY